MDGQQYCDSIETLMDVPIRGAEQAREVCVAWDSYQEAAIIEQNNRASEIRHLFDE
jgi:hypothetical protein